MPLLSALVAGAIGMLKLGNYRKTRILAAGRTAATLDNLLRVTKVAELFGGSVYPDRKSALGAPGLEKAAIV